MLVTVLVALFGAVVGAGISVSLAYALFAGEDAVALVATVFVFLLVGIPVGAVMAVKVWRRFREFRQSFPDRG